MHNLTEFLAKHNHWFVFLVLEVVSMVLLFRYNSYQGSVWFSSANAVTGKVYEWDSAVESYFSLSGVNSQLTQRNAFLEQQVRMLDDSIARLTRSQETAVTRLSSMVPFQGCRLIPAKVVANMVNRYDNLITIDKGSADGVKRDMGVVCGMGVVGIVYLVSEHYSIVIPALNSHSNISSHKGWRVINSITNHYYLAISLEGPNISFLFIWQYTTNYFIKFYNSINCISCFLIVPC